MSFKTKAFSTIPAPSPPPPPPPSPPSPNPTKFPPSTNWKSTDLTCLANSVVEIPPRSYPTYPDRCPLPTINTKAAAVKKTPKNAEAFMRASRLVEVKRSPSSPNRPRTAWPTLDPASPQITRTDVPEGTNRGECISFSGQMRYLNPRPTPHIPRASAPRAPVPRVPVPQVPAQQAQAPTTARYSTKPERPASNYYWNNEKQEWSALKYIQNVQDTPKDTEKNLKRERFRNGIKSVIDMLRGGEKYKKGDDQARRDALKAKISYPLGLVEKKRGEKG